MGESKLSDASIYIYIYIYIYKQILKIIELDIKGTHTF